jgi:orotate phosphoribosyltransferase
MLDKYKEEFIEFMIESDVLKFGEFITKSKRKTPFFINTGNYTTGEQLIKLGDFYAKAINKHFDEIDVLFGPAYKGIPLTVSVSMSMKKLYNKDIEYCSNRKEIKDHGEGGILLGAKLNKDKKVLIVEDVMTAGTSIYETEPIIRANENPKIQGIIISVDRMERGKGEKSAQEEIKEKFNIDTYSIVTMKEVVDYLYNREINGKIYIDDKIKKDIDAYYEKYGIKDTIVL